MKRILLITCLLTGLLGNPAKSATTAVGPVASASGSFTAGDKTFLLNGKPFLVKAAEMHYPRIPREYWDQRMKLCKSLGMNTICMYVFWNIHEQEEGQYDFTGNNDLAEFVRTAQRNGLYVIVRPGPYVCAEWEMGGLPWWLLKKKDIALRTQDPYFLERTSLFLKEVGKQLAPLQISNGGNIIMVQVENEYGSYGIDKPYIANIRDMVKDAGFNGVPLFQCDWSSNFTNNALDDLLWTVNFGTGANIGEQFRQLEQLRPNTPLMCSEFWSGWFDNWGRKHETRNATDMVDGLKQMLDRNISFSLYMTHGGTCFGHWGGANSPGFSPMCSSYDYDAPISESGKTTPKFFLLQQLLANYLPAGEKLPALPDTFPVISIPTFPLTETCPLFEHLPEPIRMDSIQSMEFFNQGYGDILYRTRISPSQTERLLEVNEAHDWAQIFVNGVRVGTLDRRKGEKTVLLPATPEGATLDILVEAMGRINFGRAIKDYKGITSSVELKDRDRTRSLKHWEIFLFPFDTDFINNQPFSVPALALKGSAKQKYSVDLIGRTDSKGSAVLKTPANPKGFPNPKGPAYLKGSFRLKKTGDTFLDMRGRGKGMVWINGHAIGRFWEIGPQQTLYVPGCWLKKGENEIIILDLISSENRSIQALKAPILDDLRNPEPATHRAAGQNLDLSEERPVLQSSFSPGNGWKKEILAPATPARYLCLEALNAQDDKPYAAIAELEVLDENGMPMSREHWKVLYADSEETSDVDNNANKLFDLQESTFWHTQYSGVQPDYPHQLVIDLGQEVLVGGFMYMPRAESGKPGMIKDYRLYLKTTPFKF
jgi:beta-galactosidase